MTQPVTAGDLFDKLQDRLELSWVAGKKGASRVLEAEPSLQLRPALVGYLNMVHPNKVQIIGDAELKYLDKLESRRRWSTVAEIFAESPTALILSDNLSLPDDLRDSARETVTPVFASPRPSHELLNYLQYFLARELAQRITLHGVFMEVLSIGVLVTGSSGSGKSELALELLSRGHRLIADDSPEFTLIAPDVLDGTCPEVLQDCLEVRGLGVLNVREMFGDSAVKPNKYLRLITHLTMPKERGDAPVDRLHGDATTRDVLGVKVPVIGIPVAPGRNLSVLVEVAVRNHILKLKGYDPARAFIERHARHMQSGDDNW